MLSAPAKSLKTWVIIFVIGCDIQRMRQRKLRLMMECNGEK
jgi:hypothetical protein